jgi:hypothetical protein
MTDLIKYPLFLAGAVLALVVLVITIQEFKGFYGTANARGSTK